MLRELQQGKQQLCREIRRRGKRLLTNHCGMAYRVPNEGWHRTWAPCPADVLLLLHVLPGRRAPGLSHSYTSQRVLMLEVTRPLHAHIIPPITAKAMPCCRPCCESSCSCHSASILSPAWGARTLEMCPSTPEEPEPVPVPPAWHRGKLLKWHWILWAALGWLNMLNVGDTTSDTGLNGGCMSDVPWTVTQWTHWKGCSALIKCFRDFSVSE